MTAPAYGYHHRGIIDAAGALPDFWLVRVPSINPSRPLGPLPSTVPDLAPGDRVLLSQIGTTRDDLVITGKLPPVPPSSILPIDIDDVTGLQAALDNRATDAELSNAVATLTASISSEHTTNVAQNSRLDGHDTSITALQAVDTSLDGRLDSIEPTVASNTANIATNTANIASNTSTLATHTSQITTLNNYSQVFSDAQEFDVYGDLFSAFPRIWTSNVRTLASQTAHIWRTRTRVGSIINRLRVIVATAGVGTGTVTGSLYTSSTAAGPYTLAASANNALTALDQQNFTFASGVTVPVGTYIILLLVRSGTYTTSPQIVALQNAVQRSAGLNPTIVWGTKAAVASPPATITITDGTWTADTAPWWVAAA